MIKFVLSISFYLFILSTFLNVGRLTVYQEFILKLIVDEEEHRVNSKLETGN